MREKKEKFKKKCSPFERLEMAWVFLFQSRLPLTTFFNCTTNLLKRLGIEGLVMFKRDIQFDADNYTITAPSSTDGAQDVTISVSDKVTVNIEVEKDKNTQRGRVKMTLVHPVDSSSL